MFDFRFKFDWRWVKRVLRLSKHHKTVFDTQELSKLMDEESKKETTRLPKSNFVGVYGQEDTQGLEGCKTGDDYYDAPYDYMTDHPIKNWFRDRAGLFRYWIAMGICLLTFAIFVTMVIILIIQVCR